MTTPADAQRAVFVLGAPRSGTTLVQRILNSYDDVLVWGEHAGVLQQLAEGFYRGLGNENLFRNPRPLDRVLHDSDPLGSWQAWMNWFGRDDWHHIFAQTVDLLFRPDGLPGKRFWGFKEVRYMNRPSDRTLDFLHALFPDATYLFVVRNPFNVIASGRRTPEGAHDLPTLIRVCDTWRSRYAAYRTWHASGRIRSFWIVYEGLITGRSDIEAALAALGKSMGERQHAVLQSESGRASSFKDDAFNERWESLSPLWRAVIRAALGDVAASLGYAPPAIPRVHGIAGHAVLAGLRARQMLERARAEPGGVRIGGGGPPGQTRS